jgi:hypothetical protein
MEREGFKPSDVEREGFKKSTLAPEDAGILNRREFVVLIQSECHVHRSGDPRER